MLVAGVGTLEGSTQSPGGQHLEPWRAARVRRTSDTKRSPIGRNSFEIIIKHGDAFPRDVIGRGTSSQLPWLSACLAPHSSIISRSLRFVSAASPSAGHGGTERHSGVVVPTRSQNFGTQSYSSLRCLWTKPVIDKIQLKEKMPNVRL